MRLPTLISIINLSILALSVPGLARESRELVTQPPPRENFSALNYYTTLGVAQDATLAEIKLAYRRLSVKYHPDRNPGDKEAERKYKLINEAFETLKDPRKRAHYDRYGIQQSGGDQMYILMHAFLKATDIQRQQIWNQFAHAKAWPALDEMTHNLSREVTKNPTAFDALLFIFRNSPRPSDAHDAGIRWTALQGLSESHAFDPDFVERFTEVVRDVFYLRRPPHVHRFGDSAYETGVIVAGFFSSQNISDEQFVKYFPEMNRRLLYSHSVAWGPVNNRMVLINDKFPNMMKDLLSTYTKGVRYFIREGTSTNLILAHDFDIAMGLLQLARLRPEFSEQVFRTFLEAKPVWGRGLAFTLIREAPTDALAYKTMTALLSLDYPPEQLGHLKSLIEYELMLFAKDLKKMKSKKKADEAIAIKEVVATILNSNLAKKSQIPCGTWLATDIN